MSPNPYQGPSYETQGASPPPMNRTPFILAGIGASLASVYWAGLTLLIGVGVAAGSLSTFQVVLPCVLIGLYMLRGYQLFKGDPAAATRVLWLHGLGGLMAVINIASGSPLIVGLQAIKLLIHVFGGVTAFLAQREFARSQGRL